MRKSFATLSQVAAVGCASATAAVNTPPQPSQPSSYGAQPLANVEPNLGGNWTWVLTTNQHSPTPGSSLDPDTTSQYTFLPFCYDFVDGSASSSGYSGYYESTSAPDQPITGVAAYVGGLGNVNPPGPVLSNSIWPIGGSMGESYDVAYTREWVGNGNPSAHVATATAGGSAGESLRVVAGAYAASNGSVTDTLSGSCEGVNPAPTGGAAVENQTTTVKADYSNVGYRLSANGNAGNPIGLILGTSHINVTGSVDQNSTANGVGNATGGASFSVAPMPDSKDTAQPNITVSASGTVGVTTSGSGQSPGYVKLKGTSTLNSLKRQPVNGRPDAEY